MNINRYNYEEYFMLYIDNELSAAERKLVEDFANAHSDLAEELTLLQQTVLPSGTTTVFKGKEALLQPEHSNCLIDIHNYDTYFVLYADDELNNLEKEAVELFVYKHPQFQNEFELLQKVKLSPDQDIQFADKSILYRYEKNEKPVIMMWWRYAAAALLILMAGLWWLNNNKNEINPSTLVASTPSVSEELTASSDKKTNATSEITTNENVLAQNTNDDPNITPTIEPATSNKINQANHFAKNGSNNSIQQTINTVSNTDGKNLTASKINLPDNATPNTTISINNIQVNSNELAIDQPMKIATAESETVSYAVVNTQQNDENIYIGNTSVNKKNGLRGFIRKASRVIEKTTNIGNGENSGKGILIGNIEIALR